MNYRKLTIAIISLALFGSLLTGIVDAVGPQTQPAVTGEIANVLNVTPATSAVSNSYVVAEGKLYSGRPGDFRLVATPAGVMVGAVAADPANLKTLYVGALDSLTLYRTTDNGSTWSHFVLSDKAGSVTTLAYDSAEKLLYAGTQNDGIFRLRDVGSTLTPGGHQALDERITDLAVDGTGKGLVFITTEQGNLYRGDNFGLNWVEVTTLGTGATAVEIANTLPATVYVGTTDRGLLASTDGVEWTTVNHGLGLLPGSRLTVNDVAVDPVQPNVLYVATSYLYGSSTVTMSPIGISMSSDKGAAWSAVATKTDAAIAKLLPFSGNTGSVYAVAMNDRTARPYGNAPALTANAATVTAPAATTNVAAWVIAGLAALSLIVAVALDLRRSRKPATTPVFSRVALRSR